MQHRQEKINWEIKRVIAEILTEVKDPRLGKMISVTDVEATNDLKQAKVFVSVLGDEKMKQEAMDVLKTSAGFIRHELGEKMELHTLPDLIFALDESIDNGARIDEILNEIKSKG